MTYLPKNDLLQVDFLNEVFNNTTNGYKFYWFWAILDEITLHDKNEIEIPELSITMMSLVWYPLDYYKLSFGKQDGFKKLASSISEKMHIHRGSSNFNLRDELNSLDNLGLIEEIKKESTVLLNRWVAYRFLRPFFDSQLQGIKDQYVNSSIRELANKNIGLAPYSFDGDKIVLDTNWKIYLQKHQYILRGFIKWHLLKFVQKNNPNIIGLSFYRKNLKSLHLEI